MLCCAFNTWKPVLKWALVWLSLLWLLDDCMTNDVMLTTTMSQQDHSTQTKNNCLNFKIFGLITHYYLLPRFETLTCFLAWKVIENLPIPMQAQTPASNYYSKRRRWMFSKKLSGIKSVSESEDLGYTRMRAMPGPRQSHQVHCAAGPCRNCILSPHISEKYTYSVRA